MEFFEEVAPRISRLRMPFGESWTGVTLVLGEKNALIDTGGCAETVDTCLVPALAARSLTLSDIDAVLLTHTHGDHIGGLARICELNSGIHVAACAPFADKVRNPLVYMRRIRGRFPEYSNPAPDGLRGAEPDILLEDGEALYGYLRLLHTPGHDSDTLCWMDERSDTLITGDSLQLNGTLSQGCALVMDAKGYRETLRRLLRLCPQYIVTGHSYLPLGDIAQGADGCAAYIEKCSELFAFYDGFVSGMTAAGVSDAPSIARALIGRIGGKEPAKLCLPLFTVNELMKG